MQTIQIWRKGCLGKAAIGIAALLLLGLCGRLVGGGGSTTVSAPPAAKATALPPGTITRADLGDDWPLTVESGQLACRGAAGVGAVTFTTGGTTYAVNGTAKGSGQYADIAAIWAPNPDVPGTKKDLGPLIQRGLTLCS